MVALSADFVGANPDVSEQARDEVALPEGQTDISLKMIL
jgi:hypothetical protein